MTDRISGYVVTLENDIREDAAVAITKALSMVKGVLSVEPVTADPFNEAMWRSRAHSELVERVFEAIRSVTFGDRE